MRWKQESLVLHLHYQGIVTLVMKMHQKANLLCLDWFPMAEPTCQEFQALLNTGRTVEQWHTRTKTRSIDILNDLAPESWIDINPKDADKLKVKNGDRMSISSARGRVEDVMVRVTQSVACGNIFVPFHYNTQLVNALTNESFCPKSGEPNFKQTAIQLHSEEVPDGLEFQEPEISGQIEHVKTTYEGIKMIEKELVETT